MCYPDPPAAHLVTFCALRMYACANEHDKAYIVGLNIIFPESKRPVLKAKRVGALLWQVSTVCILKSTLVQKFKVFFCFIVGSFDYESLFESATFDVGAMQGDELCFNITIIEDNLVENDELFFVNLFAPDSFVILHQISVPVDILDQDMSK